jgi:L-ascorbate metabolism protein UlaG (beta-lactamase superfamily)
MKTAAPLVLESSAEPTYDHGSIFFVGTATVILRYAGFTVLTDPNFLHKGDHVHLGYGLTAKRLANPAIELEALPPIDFVLLSHLHEDHFDRLVLQRLDRALPIITTVKAARALARHGFGHTIGLAPWQTQEIVKGSARCHVSAMPGRHGPPLVHLALPPVMGSMVEFDGPAGGNAVRLYISGDTLVYRDLREIPRRYPTIDLGLLHLGGTRVLGLYVTMNGKQGVEALRLVNPHVALPIHYDDYSRFKSPLEDFAREVAAAGLEDRVHYLQRGETYVFEVPESRLVAPGGAARVSESESFRQEEGSPR